MTPNASKKLFNFFELSAFFCAFGALIFVLAQMTPQLKDLLSPPLSHFRLSGNIKHVDETLRELRALDEQRFFHADLRQIKERVETLPWVRHAEITKVWPNVMLINITEHTAAAKWGERKLLSLDGQVYEPKSFNNDALPVFRAAPGREAFLLSIYEKLANNLSACEMVVEGIEEDGRGSLNLLLGNGVVAMLGRQAREEKLQRFINLCKVAATSFFAKVERMDFRHSYGLAVSWKKSADAVTSKKPGRSKHAMHGA